MLLKPASPTPSNTGSLRSFHRDTDKGIKVHRYCDVLQRGGAQVYRCAITAPRVTRTGTYGTGRAPKRGCIGLHQILYNIYNTATDRRCKRSHSNTPPVKTLAPLTTRSSSLRCVSAAEHYVAAQYSRTGRTILQNISQEAIYHGILARTSRCKAFEKLLWKQSEDASQKSS